jgi:hypothetical protein
MHTFHVGSCVWRLFLLACPAPYLVGCWVLVFDAAFSAVVCQLLSAHYCQ